MPRLTPREPSPTASGLAVADEFTTAPITAGGRRRVHLIAALGILTGHYGYEQDNHNSTARKKAITTVAIKTSKASDEQKAIDVLVLAFSADPAVRWMYPDPQQYLRNFPEFVQAFGGKAFEHGTAYHIDGFSGAALWLPPDVHPNEEPLAVLIERSVAEQERKNVFVVIEQMASHHPSEPHWYLPLIGVDPIQQRKGLGSALMKYVLVRCDRNKQLAYLESTNPKNIPLYEREGFERIGTIQTGTSAPIYPMVRKPR